jgi:putative FmdB family regulatory protein
MPLYEYSCGKCGLEFEELKSSRDQSDTTPCPNCKEASKRQMSSFAPVVAGGTVVEPVDMTIGREADKRWQNYHDRQSKRHNNQELKVFDLPKAKDGKYMPVMALGDKDTVRGRKNYVGALQSHRQERIRKGIQQFSGSGAF